MSSAKQTLRTRLLMAGAFIGAILTLSLSWAFSWDEAPIETSEPSPREVARQSAFHAKPGTCLSWTQPRAADARIVPCAEPHLFEVTSVQDVSKRFPRGAPPPDLKGWRELADKVCGENIERYLGQPLDPNGRYSLNVLRPTSQEWTRGERQVRCGLQRTGPGGGMLTTTGHAADQPQSSVFEPGTCLGLMGKSVGDPVDCAKPHAYEIVATVDLTEEFKFTDGYPSTDEQQAWLDKRCNSALEEYTGGANISDKGLLLGWEVVQEESWEAGSTQVNCKVGKPLEDGSGLAPVTGSISEQAETTTTTTKSAPASSSDGG